MEIETKQKPDEVEAFFLQAWDEATNNFQKFITTYTSQKNQ